MMHTVTLSISSPVTGTFKFAAHSDAWDEEDACQDAKTRVESYFHELYPTSKVEVRAISVRRGYYFPDGKPHL